MKLSVDEKKVVKSLVGCTVIGIAVNVVIDLIQGRFTWQDTLLFSLFLILGFSILGVFYILGMKVPKK